MSLVRFTQAGAEKEHFLKCGATQLGGTWSRTEADGAPFLRLLNVVFVGEVYFEVVAAREGRETAAKWALEFTVRNVHARLYSSRLRASKARSLREIVAMRWKKMASYSSATLDSCLISLIRPPIVSNSVGKLAASNTRYHPTILPPLGWSETPSCMIGALAGYSLPRGAFGAASVLSGARWLSGASYQETCSVFS